MSEQPSPEVIDEAAKKKIIGENELSTFVKYDVANDYPFIHSGAIEHSGMCLACAQSSMRHHVGVGNPLDEANLKTAVAYMANITEYSNNILEHSNKMLIENQKQIVELRDLQEQHNKNYEIIRSDNIKANKEMLDGFKSAFKDDLTKFYKVVAIVAIPLTIVMGFVASLFG